MSKFIDLSGKRFERLTVIEQAGKNKSGSYCWLCQCDCGNSKVVRGGDLKNNHTRSCGCLREEKSQQRATKHGHNEGNGKQSKTYNSWRAMKDRCINSNNHAYQHYGGRGITICKRWLKFENFLVDMGDCPEGDFSIDRKDNSGNYCKTNCRWATVKQQRRNQRSNRIITHDGKTQCLSAWAEELGVLASTLRSRISLYHWSIDKALTTPVKRKKK